MCFCNLIIMLFGKNSFKKSESLGLKTLGTYVEDIGR